MPTRAAFLMRRTTPAGRLALLACLALGLGAAGLAGCAAGPAPEAKPTADFPTFDMPTPGPITHYTLAPAALQSKVDCLANSSWLLHGESPAPAVADLMGGVPQGFVPVDVVECRRNDASATTAATPSPPTIRERHFSGDYAPLIAALAVPSDRQTGIACEAMLEVTPDLWLVDSARRAVHVTWPKTACNFSKPGVQKALDGLAVASTTTLNRPAAP